MNLYLDSNVWLSFYHYSNDDLEQLRKVDVLLKQKRLTLFLPEQTINEVRRNRDGKIASAITRFKVDKLAAEFPRICQDYEEYDAMRKAIREFQEAKARLLERLTNDSTNGLLKADEIIAQLFQRAQEIPMTEEILARAKQRRDLGNPPGKEGSYGDAINWECLLAEVPQQEDLFFVTNDSDYFSKISEDEFSPFLQYEWTEKKQSSLFCFSRLSTFFGDRFPEIRFAADLERELLITDLTESSSFARTRRTLRQLVGCSDFTPEQINAIVDATLSNNQIYWIAGDADINGYLKRLVAGQEAIIEPDKLEKFNRLLVG